MLSAWPEYDDAEDEDGQQRDNHLADGAVDDIAEVIERGVQCHASQVGHAQPQHKGQHQRRHHAHERGNLDAEVGCGVLALGRGGAQRAGLNERGEDAAGSEIGRKARDDGGGVGQGSGSQQHAAGLLADIGNGRRYQPQDEQGNDEAEKLAEQPVERGECADDLDRQVSAQQHTQDHGNDNTAY